MNDGDSAEVRGMIREEITRLWTKMDKLEEKVGKLNVRLAQVSLVTGGVVTLGNTVAALLLNHFFGFFVGGTE